MAVEVAESCRDSLAIRPVSSQKQGQPASQNKTYRSCSSSDPNEGSGETYITSADLINSCLIYYVCQGLVDYAAAGGSAALPTTESQGQAPDPFDWVDTNLFDVLSKSG